MGCKTCCSEEFKVSNFGLNHDRPELFVTSQYGWHPFVYMFYCIFWMLYTVTWCILSGAVPYYWYDGEENRVKWFIYLTNWAYFILTLSVIVKAITAIMYVVKQRGTPLPVFDGMPWYLKLNWILHNVSFPGLTIVGLVFWIFLVPLYTMPVHVIDIHTHGISLVYLFTDVFVTAIPIRVYHCLHSLIFGVVYVVFTVIYTFAGGYNALNRPYIYSGVVDWLASPTWTAIYVVVLVVVGIPLFHTLAYGLYRLRVFLHSKCVWRQVTDKSGTDNAAYDVQTTDL